MEALNDRLITIHMTNGAFHLLGRIHTVATLRWLDQHPEGSILNDIDYGVPIRSHKGATDLMTVLVEAGWARRDSVKKYYLTKDGQAALALADSGEAKLVIPTEMKGRGYTERRFTNSD